MGRKKQDVIIEEELNKEADSSKEESALESTIRTTSSFTYTGKVKVSIKKGDKVYSTKTYKNAGRWPLFKFFDYALRGEYTQADFYRPKVVNLFYLDNAGVIPTINDSDNNPDVGSRVPPYHTLFDFYEHDLMKKVSIIGYPYLTTPAVTEKDNTETAGIGFHSVTYKFNIPFTQIGDVSNGINTICLYGKINQTDLANPSCFFFVEDPDHPGYFGNLLEDLIEEGMKLSDFSLLLE